MSVTPEKVDTSMSKGYVLQYVGIPANDEGALAGAARFAGQHSDKSVQIGGTFGGATVTLKGSNDGAAWHTLTDPLGNALSFTAAGLKMVVEATRYIKPVVTGGDGTTAVDVHLFMKEV
jgi:hypothetical protein